MASRDEGLAGAPENLRNQGQAELRDFCLNINVLLRGLHLLHLPTFSIDGDHATGSLHFQIDYGLTAPDTHEITAVTGLYEVDYRLTDVGWRIEHRR